MPPKVTTTQFNTFMDGAEEEALKRTQEDIRYQLEERTKQYRVIEDQRTRVYLEMSELETRLRSINKKLDCKPYVDSSFDKYNLILTDHAVLRYMERILKFDIAGIKRQIIDSFPDKLHISAISAKAGKTLFKIAREKDRVVVITVIDKKY